MLRVRCTLILTNCFGIELVLSGVGQVWCAPRLFYYLNATPAHQRLMGRSCASVQWWGRYFWNVACTDIVRLLGKASNICFSRYEQPAVICRFVRLFAPLTHVRTVMHKHAPWPRHRHRHALHNLKIFKKQFNYIFTHAYTLQQVTLAEQISPEYCCLMLSLVSLLGQHQWGKGRIAPYLFETTVVKTLS